MSDGTELGANQLNVPPTMTLPTRQSDVEVVIYADGVELKALSPLVFHWEYAQLVIETNPDPDDEEEMVTPAKLVLQHGLNIGAAKDLRALRNAQDVEVEVVFNDSTPDAAPGYRHYFKIEQDTVVIVPGGSAVGAPTHGYDLTVGAWIELSIDTESLYEEVPSAPGNVDELEVDNLFDDEEDEEK